jgi:hypothetical protein
MAFRLGRRAPCLHRPPLLKRTPAPLQERETAFAETPKATQKSV